MERGYRQNPDQPESGLAPLLLSVLQLILIIKHLEEGWFFEKTKLELRTHASSASYL